MKATVRQGAMTMNKRLFMALVAGLVLIASGRAFSEPAIYREYDSNSISGHEPVNKVIDPERLDLSLMNAAIFHVTNKHRLMNGMKPFLHSPALELAAKEHSEQMVSNNFFSHTSPVQGRETMVRRLAAVGIFNANASENIADVYILNFPPNVSFQIRQDGYYYKGKKLRNKTYLEMAESVLNGWMNSPGHRANILSSHTTYLGAGTAIYGATDSERIKATQNFANKPGATPN